ncbi:SDR family oxidoreductase [Asaia sp. VD9]|uniref:SDR family oxidoreductase n=1 Tax=Asaia sp. VD9 TaxID=3081235 RepID=UPI0030166113
MTYDLNGKRILVIGGSSGIGLAAARSALMKGALVTIASRSLEKLERARAELGDACRCTVLDIRDFDAVAAFFNAYPEWDHVVISAAQTPSGPIRSLSMQEARQAVDSKFWGAYHVAKAARLSASGSLSLVSGFLSVRPSASSVLQGAINAALEGLVRGLALELSPVRVNAVSPGLIDTPLWAKMDEGKRAAMFARAGEHLPAGRVGNAEDIAQAILFVMRNGFATGSTVRVDGGGAIG